MTVPKYGAIRRVIEYRRYRGERGDGFSARSRKRIELIFECGHKEIRVDYDNPTPERSRCGQCRR